VRNFVLKNNKIHFIAGVANPNWSLGHIWKKLPKILTFRATFIITKNGGKTSKISKNNRFLIRVWVTEIFFWAEFGLSKGERPHNT
jgi:hypothetical protein